MSGSHLVFAELDLDREVRLYRTWWAMDRRIAGNPLSLLLYYRCFRPGEEVTQAQAMEDLGLARSAFRTAKERLRRAGFLVEVRDRYPSGDRDPGTGEPRGGQNRYQLWFLDPEPGVEVSLENSLIVADEPVERVGEIPVQTGCTKRPPGASPGGRNVPRVEKSLFPRGERNVHPTPDPVDNSSPGGRNVPPLIGNTGLGRLVGSQENFDQPTYQTYRARDAEPAPTVSAAADPGTVAGADVDAQLEALAPGCRLTVAAIATELQGRVDLALVDVVQATRETLLRAKTRVENPASYVAAVIARKPDAWPSPGVREPAIAPFDPGNATAPPSRRDLDRARSEACSRGEHDWGPETWGELARSACVWCSVARRKVDSTFAELEDELHPIGGARWDA